MKNDECQLKIKEDMMKFKSIFSAVAVSMLLSGCGIYNSYQQDTEVPENTFGTSQDMLEANTEGTLATLSWREFFPDPYLQNLIEQALENNTDLNSARIAVEKSEASLRAARSAYLPSINFSPQGSIASFDGGEASKTYNLPLQMSWDIDVFGSITNKKRASKAVLMQAQMREEAVRANLISTLAQQYYMLLVLDRQLEILTETDSLRSVSLETQKHMWNNGKAYSTAVNQMESSYLNVKAQVVDTRRNIRNVENNICSLLAITPQHIERNYWGNAARTDDSDSETGQRMFDSDFLMIGVPANLLELRPDIRMANFALEEAFYNTQAARSAFYPTITLSGSAGWTNNAGSSIVNPGKILLNAMASLTQPILSRGKLTQNLKIAKLTQEDMQKKYVQTVIDAGNQVNEAMADCQVAREKHGYYHRQVEVLHDAYFGTQELMDSGKANYLEVLTAQENLLNSQLNEAMNMYHGAQAVIALYIALGGATR